MKDWTMGIQTPKHDNIEFSEIQSNKKSSTQYCGSSKGISQSSRLNAFQQKLNKFKSQSFKKLDQKMINSRIEFNMNTPVEFTQRLKRKEISDEFKVSKDKVIRGRVQQDEILFFNDAVQEIYGSDLE